MYGTGMKSITQPLVVILHYREECLNSSRLNEFSIVSINRAIHDRRKSPSLGSVFKVYTIGGRKESPQSNSTIADRLNER